MMRWALPALVVLAGLGAAVAVEGGAANAEDGIIVVNSLNLNPDTNLGDARCDVDAGTTGDQCTLIAALQYANLNPSGQTRITFSVSGTIAITSTLVLEKPIRIYGGAGAPDITINGTGLPSDAPCIQVNSPSLDGTIRLFGLKVESCKGPGIEVLQGWVYIGGPGTSDGVGPTNGNRIGNNAGPGILIHAAACPLDGPDATTPKCAIIRSNWIGIYDDGKEHPNQGHGINVTGGTRVQIGGPTGAEGNYIGNNTGDGVHLGPIERPVVQSNRIGVDAQGKEKGNGGDGIHLNDTRNATVGAFITTTSPAATTIGANTIRFNAGAGVNVTTPALPTIARGNVIRANLIYNNTGQQIDLGGGGRSFADVSMASEVRWREMVDTCPPGPPDCDDDPNDGLNFPIVEDASFVTGIIKFNMVGPPGLDDVRIDFYAARDCWFFNATASLWLGSTLIDLDHRGYYPIGSVWSSFDRALLADEDCVTATATTAVNGTSEFAPRRTISFETPTTSTTSTTTSATSTTSTSSTTSSTTTSSATTTTTTPASGTNDADSDGLSDAAELALGTDPDNADTDGDGASDLIEVAAGTDPSNPVSVPEEGEGEDSPALGFLAPIVLLGAAAVWLRRRLR